MAQHACTHLLKPLLKLSKLVLVHVESCAGGESGVEISTQCVGYKRARKGLASEEAHSRSIHDSPFLKHEM